MVGVRVGLGRVGDGRLVTVGMEVEIVAVGVSKSYPTSGDNVGIESLCWQATTRIIAKRMAIETINLERVYISR
jgi:hypothetical protein